TNGTTPAAAGGGRGFSGSPEGTGAGPRGRPDECRSGRQTHPADADGGAGDPAGRRSTPGSAGTAGTKATAAARRRGPLEAQVAAAWRSAVGCGIRRAFRQAGDCTTAGWSRLRPACRGRCPRTGHGGRSEERRVGKECRSRRSPEHGKKNNCTHKIGTYVHCKTED